VVVEPDLATLATSLELHDLAKPIRDNRLTFLTSSDPGRLHERLARHNLRIMAGTRLISSPPADQLHGPFMARLRQAVADYVSMVRMGMMTLLLNNELTLRNVAGNLARYVASPPVQTLRQRFAGFPAVVVAAGPSLHATLPGLKRFADRLVIIAVQTALRPLLEAGIAPHFVTTLDYHELGQRFFQDLPPAALARVHMVAEPKAHWRVLDAFADAQHAGPSSAPTMISLLGNDQADLLLGRAAPAVDRLKAGATVAHLAFYLAQYLGCDPIIFLGQDLGFTNGTYYSPGTAIHRIWAGELNRFNSIESMEWQRIVRDPQALRRLTDIHDRPIYTDEQMFTYLQQFERDFADAPQQIIDATGGGVRKAGTTIMSFDDAAAQFATRPLPADLLAYRDQLTWWDADKLPAAADAIAERIEQVEQLEKVCVRTRDLLAKLVELLPKDLAAFNRTIIEVDEQRLWVRQHPEVLRLVIQVSQVAEYQRHQADRSLRINGTDGLEKRKFQLARDQAYVGAILTGCTRALAILRSAQERLAKRD
ncbi:MAG: DUF115 domain-containing protein, partial [Phycisphaerae bacterium]|nr:DUF115 domain-containing protein [Phycisphaerae bacterium]